MEEPTVSFDILIHPNKESLKKREEFMSSMEKTIKIEKMDIDGIKAEWLKEWKEEQK